ALTLAELKPQSATARLEAERWLAMGPFEVPHAELTGTIAVDADLSSPHRTVDVELVDLLLSQPNRYFRAHSMETIGDSDVTYITDEAQVGLRGHEGTVVRLVDPVPSAPETPPVALASNDRVPDVAVNADAETPAEPASSTTIHIRIPNEITVSRCPFELLATGDVVVRIDRDGTEIRGSVNGHEGHMEFMGNEWTFDHGGLTFDEAAPTGRFDLWFRRLGHLQANRE